MRSARSPRGTASSSSRTRYPETSRSACGSPRTASSGDEIALARPGKANNSPFAIAATATPDGFSIFFQEVQNNDPNAAHTYMVELDGTGKPGKAKEVQMPWALADVVWNGSGYQLALFYAGDGDGVAASDGRPSKDGTPQQHPDWASEPGASPTFISSQTATRSSRSIAAARGDRI